MRYFLVSHELSQYNSYGPKNAQKHVETLFNFGITFIIHFTHFLKSMERYYDRTIFHRIVKGFIVQGGDPTGTGMGGESIYGKPVIYSI